jgi:hypothetical protein
VPPPEQPWTGANLARALGTDTAPNRPQHDHNDDGGDGDATTTVFSLPFMLPAKTGGTRLASLSALLPRPTETSESSAALPHAQEHPPQQDKGGGKGAAAAASSSTAASFPGVRSSTINHRSFDTSNTAATTTSDEAVILSPSFPLDMASKTSFPTMSGSCITQVSGTAADVNGAASKAAATAAVQVHSLSSVSSDTTVTTSASTRDLSPQTLQVSAFSEPLRSSGAAASQTHNTAHPGNGVSHPNPSRVSTGASKQSATPPIASFTDLFVGLERPRLHRLSRQSGDSLGSWHLASASGGEGAGVAANAPRHHGSASLPSAVGSVTSHTFSLVHDGDDSDSSVLHEVAEDEAGAHTPSVYRSPQLPHWWRSIVTPSVGTQVCLRPNTPHLEFWWIDRLGNEAYELIQVILQHSLEGTVRRESGESVVVEFSIPTACLGSTSFAVWHPYELSAASARKAPTDAPVGAKESEEATVAVAASQDEGETTLEDTAKTVAPPPTIELNDSNNNSIDPALDTASPTTTTPVHSSDVPDAPQRSTATDTSSTVTVDPHTADAAETHNSTVTVTTDAPPRDGPLGLPALVRADSVHHDVVEPHPSRNRPTTSDYDSAASPESPGSRPRAVSELVLPSTPTCEASDGIARCDATSVPVLHHRPCRSPLTDVGESGGGGGGGKYSSLSNVDHGTSVLTAGGGYSDPFVMEWRFQQEPALTRILATSPVHKSLSPAATAESEDGEAASKKRQLQQQQRHHCNGRTDGAQVAQPRPFSAGVALADVMWKSENAIPSLRTPVTPGEKGYSPDPSDDCLHDTSVADSATGDDTEPSATPPFTDASRHARPHGGSPLYKLPTTILFGEATAQPPSEPESPPSCHPVQSRRTTRDDADDPSLLRVEPLPKSEDTSTCLDSTASPHCQASRNTSSYYDPFPRSKTYGEWLRINTATTAAAAGPGGSGKAGGGGPGGPVTPTPPWSHDDPNETTTLLGPTTSMTGTDLGVDDDSVLVRLSLPSSVCIPVVAVRLHALQLLHPLLHALTTPCHFPLFSLSSPEDEDEVEEALRTAAHVSPYANDLVTHTPTPDYRTAVQLISSAISRASKEVATAASTPMQPRDLSILHTIRSHLYFHMSPEYLYDSLKDAETALSCCPTQNHVCHTYEVLTACLISFGHTAQVERVSAHLRHRCRTMTPLLTRLGRVAQVMVSYGMLFLRQQLNTALLRCGSIGASPDSSKNPQSFLSTDGVASSTLDGRPHLTRGTYPLLDGEASTPTAKASLRVYSSSTAMPLVVVGGGIVDPPVDGQSAAAAAAPHTLPYEVCPLLLGYYGKSLHRPHDVSGHSYPLPLSPQATAADGAAPPGCGGGGGALMLVNGDGRGDTDSGAAHHHHHLRHAPLPSSDVCHRRLFLLETLFPSAMPLPTVNRLRPVASILRHSLDRGSLATRSSCSQHGRRSLPKSDPEATAAPAKNEKRIKPEDFMYDRDSMLALLASTADTTVPYGTVSMRYFGRHIRLSATRRIPKGETVLLERPAVLLVMWPLPDRRTQRRGGSQTRALPSSPLSQEWDGALASSGEPAAAAAAARSMSEVGRRRIPPATCAQCGRQRLTRVFPCIGRCGAVYCSEACRREALRLYHVMECGGAADPLPQDDPTANNNNDSDSRVRRAAATLQDIFAEWDDYLHDFANWNTPAMQSTTRIASCSPSASVSSSPADVSLDPSPLANAPPKSETRDGRLVDGVPAPSAATDRGSPPPILAVTSLRAMSRLVAMMLCMVLPIETLPQLRRGNEPLLKAWAEERHAAVRAVARTLRYRGLLVPTSTCGNASNRYCSGVDPHCLLLLEVMLQQLSVPFFADFTYGSPSTVWEAINEFPCAVQRKATPNGRTSSGKSIEATFDHVSSKPPRSGLFSFAGRTPPKPRMSGQRHWVVELSVFQREELMCTCHRLLQRMHDAVRTELEDVLVLPPTAPAQADDDDVAAGAPLHWTCPELLGFLSSTRVFEELLDFCLTSCAVVYPQNVEADAAVGTGVSNSGSNSPTPSSHSKARGQNEMVARGVSGGNVAGTDAAERHHVDVPPAVPLAVISPWTCLTVDLHPMLGHGTVGIIYSRFMVEHEQRRRMIAYCAAAATRRGAGNGGGGNLGGSDYGSGVEDDSFLSIHSMASASAAAVLGGSALSPGNDDLGRSASLRDDWSIQMLEEAANRSCANLHLSLIHSLPSSDAARPPLVAVVMTAKKTIQLGDVLWWESQNFGEYLHLLF